MDTTDDIAEDHREDVAGEENGVDTSTLDGVDENDDNDDNDDNEEGENEDEDEGDDDDDNDDDDDDKEDGAPSAKAKKARKPTTSNSLLLPYARIKGMMKDVPDVEFIGTDSVHAVKKATELFLEYFAQRASLATDKQLIGYDAVASLVSSESNLEFLKEIVPPRTAFGEVKDLRPPQVDSDDSDFADTPMKSSANGKKGTPSAKRPSSTAKSSGRPSSKPGSAKKPRSKASTPKGKRKVKEGSVKKSPKKRVKKQQPAAAAAAAPPAPPAPVADATASSDDPANSGTPIPAALDDNEDVIIADASDARSNGGDDNATEQSADTANHHIEKGSEQKAEEDQVDAGGSPSIE